MFILFVGVGIGKNKIIESFKVNWNEFENKGITR